MASVVPIAPPAETPEPEWSENRIVASLDQLQNIHIQLRQVRSSIPYLVEPLLLHYSSPDDLYTRYSQNALNTGREIRILADLMENSTSQAILQRAKDSENAEPDGITPWMVNEHPDWLDVRKIDDETNMPVNKEQLQQNEGKMTDLSEQEPSAVVERFKTQHPSIELGFKAEDPKNIEMVLPPPIPIHFHIDLNSATPTVTCTEKTKIHLGIIRAVAARPQGTSLNYLLELLLSYDDVRSRPCLKCERIIDRNGQFPVVRAEKKIGASNVVPALQWQAFHESCS